MPHKKAIQVFEHGKLIVSEEYGPDKIVFTKAHLDSLAKYLTLNQGCPFYTLYYDRVKFNQYVGVIQIDDLTIEVLPKTDKHEDNTQLWQQTLIRMLFISLQVNARTTTISSVNIKKLNVLEAYLFLFLDEVQILIHHGLVKKYRTNISNQTSLKGKLLVHQQATKNIIHAERFYVAHQVYDKDNVYNGIVKEALECINLLSVNNLIKSKCSNILLDFPICKPVNIQEKLFDRLQYDRKTDRYKTAIELAKIILLNYHPDFKGGYSNILAIMVDMNILWENYIYYILKRACNAENSTMQVFPQQKALFWRHPENWSLRLKPDLLLEERDEKEVMRRIVLDTKWKYQSDTAVEDVRQMYAYNNYFNARESYLLYPDKLIDKPVEKYTGDFYVPDTDNFEPNNKCGLMYVDLLNENGNLNLEVGADIVSSFRE